MLITIFTSTCLTTEYIATWLPLFWSTVIPSAISEPSSVMIVPSNSSGLQTRPPINILVALVLSYRSFLWPWNWCILLAFLWSSVIWCVFWPHIVYPLQHAHYPNPFIPFLNCDENSYIWTLLMWDIIFPASSYYLCGGLCQSVKVYFLEENKYLFSSCHTW